MNNPKVIFHADDLGLTMGFNKAIKESYDSGLLSSTSIRTNGLAFKDAINNVVKNSPNLSIGVHFNLIEGKISKKYEGKLTKIANKKGQFKYKFFGLLLRCFDKSFLEEIELELREQILKSKKYVDFISHINSHQYCCDIPQIFKIVCKLANEFKIKNVRISNEKLFFSNSFWTLDNPFLSSNIFKWLILKIFSNFNIMTAKKFGLKYNDHYVGILFTGKMNIENCINGIKKSLTKNEILEVLLHPYSYISSINEKFINKELRDYCLNPYRFVEKETLLSSKLFTFKPRRK